MLRLKTLKVKGHRGVFNGPDLRFDSGGLVLCGGNGTGKSSYVDSLEKVLAGRCGSLDTGDLGISWAKQGTHIKCAVADVQLVVTDGNVDTTLTLSGCAGTKGAGVDALLAAAKQKSFLLRRRELLDFILTKPRDRGRAVQGFLKLDAFVAFETKLKELFDGAELRLGQARLRKDEHERALRQKFELPSISPVGEEACRSLINQALAEAGAGLIMTMSDVKARIEEVDRLLAAFGQMEGFQKLQTLRGQLQEIPSPSPISADIVEFKRLRSERQTEESRLTGHFYAEVLEQGAQWIREDELDRCPLCDNAIDREVVGQHVLRRLSANAELTALKRKEDQALLSLRRGLDQYCATLNRVVQGWEQATTTPWPEEVGNVVRLLKEAGSACENAKPDIDVNAIDLVLALELDAIRQRMISDIDERLRGFPEIERYQRLFRARAFLVAAETHLPFIATASAQIDRLSRVRADMSKLVEHAERARKQVIQQVVDRISELASHYYSRIHPGEQTGSPTLVVPSRGFASLDLSSTFYTKRGDPRGYYSEGHLDSLGLCIFLAIRRLHHTQLPQLAILVLDDVMSTVDGDHRRATAELIFNEFRDHQIFVTTHDRLWFENLKAASRSVRCRHLLIASWSIDEGPTWGDHLSDYEWLNSPDAIKAKPADQVIRAGRLLEEMLQNLCNGMEVAVPFRIRGDYSIGPLWDNFRQAAKKNAEFWQAAVDCLEQIERLRSLRNWVGAHWNEWAQQLTPVEAQAFVVAVLQLRIRVYCDGCRQFVIRIPQLDGVWSCKCEDLRYKKTAKR